MTEDFMINKDLFNFKLGTTSFIYPDDIIPNVIKLGPFFDEIELLIFESIPSEVLPSVDNIRELELLAREFDLTYNIHLPVDISFTDESNLIRYKAVETIKSVIDLVSPLEPTTHVLHLEYNKIGDEQDWYERSFHAVGNLVKSLDHPGMISIETLDYPFGSIESLIKEYDLSVCLDAGHMIKYGHNIKPVFERFHDKIPLIHLHGVDFSKIPPQDHVSLDKTPHDKIADTLDVLKTFNGVVSLEVFNEKNLKSSLAWLEKFF
jgi:sugar phosphate isomerase/epimerase